MITVHSAFWPQVPGQGSSHLFLMHALFLGQSLLRTHSGRQPWYGSPWYSGKQVHIPLLHSAFAPHGEGEQGSVTGITKINMVNYSNLQSTLFENSCYSKLTWLWCKVTITEWISCKTFRTGAYGSVINNATSCATTTRTWAGISTFFSYTSHVTRTFRIYYTLRSTVWWHTHVIRQTRTGWRSVYISTLRVWSTRRWYAWVCDWCRYRWRC